MEEQLQRGLGNLQAAEFLYEARLFPDLEYTFKHALTHDVAYGSLLQERRRTLHRQIVETIERLHPKRLAEHVERLAHHASRGEAWDKAVTYCRQAGAKAMARAAHREAAAYVEQALSALEHLPEDRDTFTQSIDLRVELRHALWPLGENRRIIDSLEIAESLAETLADERRLVQVLTTKGYSIWMLGDSERALASSTRALAIARALDDFPLEAATNFSLGLAYHGLGEYRLATESLGRNRPLLDDQRVYGRYATAGLTSVLSLWLLALCQAELGAFVDAIANAEQAVRIAEAADHKLSLMFADLGLGHVCVAQGDLTRAIPTIERGLAICRTWDFPMWTPWLASRAGAAYALARRIADALPLLEQSMEQSTSMGWIADASPTAARMGEAYLAAGRLQEAGTLADRALGLARAHKGRGQQAWALRLLGEIASQRDPDDLNAEDHYRHALALADELGMRPLVAHCHLGLGKLYRRTGKREQAQEHLTTATTMYREMEMRFWLEKAEAELKELA